MLPGSFCSAQLLEGQTCQLGRWGIPGRPLQQPARPHPKAFYGDGVHTVLANELLDFTGGTKTIARLLLLLLLLLLSSEEYRCIKTL